MSTPRRPRRLALGAACLLLPALAVATLQSPAPAAPSPKPAPRTAAAAADDPAVVLDRDADETAAVIEVDLADTAELDRLVATGVDLDHGVEQHGDHLQVRAVVTPSEAAALRRAGFDLGRVLWTQDDADAALAERAASRSVVRRQNRAFAQRADDPTLPDASDVRIIRADYYVSFGVGYLSVEAKWADGQALTTPLTVERDSGPGTDFGSGGTQTINRFVDANVYLYHRGASAVQTTGDPAAPVRPDRVRITSPSGDVAIATVEDWLPTPGDDPFKGPGYQEDYIASYLDPTELYDRIASLAEEFPDRAELVELPFKTNGYRRKSQALLDPPGNRLVVRSGGASTEYAFVSRTGGTQPAPGGTPATSTPLQTVQAAPNPAWPDATPDQGCGLVEGFTAGNVALVTRGQCTFADKAINAQNAGASAVVVVNNVPGAAQGPGSIPGTVTVPVVGVSQADGAAIQALTAPTGLLLPAVPIAANQRIGVDSLAWGHEGGDDVSVQVVDPGTAADQDLTITVAGKSVQVSPATDGTGARTSTAAEVVAALNAHPRASQLLTAYTYRGSDGAGVVVPTRLIGLDDFLNAPAHVSHEPQQVYALRIGTAPEGEKPGVFAYAQEHAREWVPPLVTIEAAERLLRNYATHAPTKDLVDNLEVWILPSVNPDGGHYSFYDFASQRRNMVRYCNGGATEPNDAAARNAWGVDVNRNYDEYSRLDGYDGASASCTSDVYSGPSELSEAEARNVDWVAAKPNMRYSMNLHSSGNYFMWSPGAYRVPGRISAPRPSLEDETYFWQASSRILSAIKRWRGLSVTPARTGVTSDVLYSAAGNSGDMNWYKYGLYAWNFEVGTSFQPPFESTTGPSGASGHQEAMEYANGLVELMRVARDFDLDVQPPESDVVVSESSTEGKVLLRFTSDEATTIRYTLDGTVPTATNGTVYDVNGVREGGELLTVDEGAKVFWYAVDAAGNVERGYDPTRRRDNSFRKAIAEVGWEPTVVTPTLKLELADRPRPPAVGTGTVRVRLTVTAENEFGLPPSGKVRFAVSGLGNQAEATLDENGVATAVLGPFVTAGAFELVAAYYGDEVTESAPVRSDQTLYVRRASSTVAVTAQYPKVVQVDGPTVDSERARLRIRVGAVNVRPYGEVLVRNGDRVLARGRLKQDGTALLRLARFYVPGTKAVRVAYLGNDDLQPSQSFWRIRVVR